MAWLNTTAKNATCNATGLLPSLSGCTIISNIGRDVYCWFSDLRGGIGCIRSPADGIIATD